MDNLTYQYEKVINPNTQLPELDVNGKPIPKNNRLRYVHDQVNATNYTEDIDSQTPLSLSAVNSDINQAQTNDNYAYDAIGNLIKDKKEGITNISWTVYGKIGAISKTDPNTNLSTVINYTYDAAGNRITKTVQKDNELPVITYYVRDASGNVMSVYDNSSSSEASPITGTLTQKEIHLYGSDRLAIYNVKVQMEVDSRIYTSMAGTTNNQAELITFIRGNKFFELKNHLGNVLVTVSDKKLTELIYCDPAVDRNCTYGSLVGVYYKADVITATDYYPFGMQMPNRNYNNGSEYRYGFNGKENDKDAGESVQDYGMRIYDGRLGRLYSIDPLSPKYPQLTPYQFASNRPIDGVDQLGLQWTKDELIAIYNNATAALSNLASKSLITLRGTSNALVNANTFGTSDLAQHLPKWWGVGTTANLSDYDDKADQEAYLLGRVLGDASALLQSFSEVTGGLGGAGAGLATGPGALVVSSTGLIVAGHGTAVGAAASTDLGWTLGKLFSLGVSVKSTTDASTTQQTSSANSGTSSNGTTITRYDGPKPKYKVGEHFSKTSSKGGKKTKTALPKDAEQVYKNAIPDDPIKPSNWYGINRDGNVYRYSSKNSSEAHFSGQSNVGDKIRNYTNYAKERLKQLNPNVNL